MAEHLDDLLAADHFFDIAVDLAQRGLLLEEEAGGLAADALDDHQHHGDADQHEDGQPDVGHQHGDEYRDDGDQRGEHLRYGLAEHLLQRVGIVGEVAHQVAAGVRVKIADGQLLHALEHFVAHLLEDALRDRNHDAVIQEGRNNAHQIHQRHERDRVDQAGKDRRGLQQQRRDIVVDQHAQEHRTCHVRHCGKQNADQHHGELHGVAASKVTEQTCERFLRVFAALAAGHLAMTAHRSSHSGSGHYSSPPFFIWL